MTTADDKIVQEPSTGILFPRHLNGFILAGCGVRVKFGFIKGYAVGTYVDSIATGALNKVPNDINKALLNPDYAKTLRIVMNRAVPIDMFNASIIDSLTPRMNGKDVDKLLKFKELGPRQDLKEGDVIELFIQGDMLHYKNSLGGDGQIQSISLTRAVCDNYYGDDCVSSSHKEAVVAGIASMK